MKKVFFPLIILLSIQLEAAPLALLHNANKAIHEYTKLPKEKKSQLTVAVIDTGLDLKHKDIKKHLWINPGESGMDANGRNKAFNGIDDDKNGYIDDLHGWNFIKNNHNLKDYIGHGTHISGIIVGKSQPTFIKDLLPVKIMTLKYFDKNMDYSKTIDHTVESIKYAVDNGADIINYSSSGRSYSEKERKAIEYANKKGVLFVTAAGNRGKNLAKTKFYPAMYGSQNIISVSAVDKEKRILASSNYGSKSVAALGKDILSLFPGGGKKKMSGTSQATAYVSRELAHYLLYRDDRRLLGVVMEDN